MRANDYAWVPSRIGATDATVLQADRIGADFGFWGLVVRIQLAGAPWKSVVVKKRDNEREQGHAEGSPEVRFYQEIAAPCGVRVPRCHFAGVVDEHGPVLVLEDFESARQGDIISGCDDATLEAIIEQCAHLHSFAWQESRRAQYPWLPHKVQHTNEIVETASRYSESFKARYGMEVSPDVFQRLSNLSADDAKLLAGMESLPHTVVHGDLHLDNVLFDENSQPTIIDWERVAVGPAVGDLVQVIVESVDDIDEASIRAALNHYSALMQGAYPLDDLLRDFRVWLLRLGLGMMAGFGKLDPANWPPRFEHVARCEARRIGHAMDLFR